MSPLHPCPPSSRLFYFSGYICISLPEERLNELEIRMMVPENQERHKTAYTITVDYKHGLFKIL
jgi:3,4-dihydroxy-2-butanone 4-phosphate synthase